MDPKVLMQEGDGEIIDGVISLKDTHIPFEIIEVPRGDVKSTPNTCNFVLKWANGIDLTIFDGQDMPEKHQLKKVVRVFQSLPKEYASVQAEFNCYNHRENFLTKCFSVEYSMRGDVTLRFVTQLKSFFLLGGSTATLMVLLKIIAKPFY
jgi:cellulose synthase/poly-beta-1,6-N-acetylglucosamine synthase-like glycosyltransferase